MEISESGVMIVPLFCGFVLDDIGYRLLFTVFEFSFRYFKSKQRQELYVSMKFTFVKMVMILIKDCLKNLCCSF